MTVYWRIGQFLIGLYLVFQCSLWLVHQFSAVPEVIQDTGKALLDRHLQQHLPKYYHKITQSKEVWQPPLFTDTSVNRLIDTLLPGTIITALDSISAENSSEHQWLKVAYQDNLQVSQSGWITSP